MNVLINISELTPATGFVLLTLMILFNSISLKKKGITIHSEKTTLSGKKQLISLLFLPLLFLFLVEITWPLYHFSLLPVVLKNLLVENIFLRFAGGLAIFVSAFLMKTTLQDFGTSLRFGLSEKNAGKLVTNGIFAKSRNPFFLSLLLFFTGTALIFPNLFFLIFAVSAFAGIHLSILREEKFLRKVCGNEYLDYQKQVRRYF